MRALCIDDHPVNRQVLVVLLATAGIEADEAGSATEGLQLLDAVDYDLVFMDLRMPEMDGREAAALIRGRSDWKRDVPIILVTADVEFSIGAPRIDNDFDGAIFKPIKPDALFGSIASALVSHDADTISLT